MFNLPGDKKFALTIFDDTDNATVETVKPIYDLLCDLRIFTTKSLWVFPTEDTQNPYRYSQTLADSGYVRFIRRLQDQGFEAAFHNASMQSSDRDTTISAIEKFRELLGHYPNVYGNHHENKENLYWGSERLTFQPYHFIMNIGTRRLRGHFQGHRPDSPYFWGDICQKYITYVRGFTFREINLLRINPTLPYRDPERPFVRYWFSSSEGSNVRSFNDLLRIENQERLEHERGVCIVYTHFGNPGFVQNGRVNPHTEYLLTSLSERMGWFVPVSTLLDYLRTLQRSPRLSGLERFRIETIWFLSKIIHGTS